MNSDTSRSIRVGLFFIFGAVLLWMVYDTFTAPNAYRENGYPLRAPFADVKQLKVGSDVRLSGVSIGSVANLRLEGGQAIALLSIDHKNEIPIDSIATITTAGLLGNNYISIQTGQMQQYLTENDTIKTREGADMNKIVEKLGEIGEKVSHLLDDFSGKDKDSLLSSVNGMIGDIRPKLNVLFDNLNNVTNHISSGQGSLGKLIYQDTAHVELLSVVDNIKKAATGAEQFFKDAGSIVNKLSAQGEGPLSVILHDKTTALHLRESLANIHGFSQKLNNDHSTLGKLMSSDDLHAQAESILNKVSNAVESIENSGPMTAVGIAAGALF